MKMKVFLSSTAQDLVAYRQMADDTILRLSQETVAMERFGPLPGAPVDECERLARESDVIICIVAHRYGFVPQPSKGSITEREVRAAHTAGKAVLAWIVDDTHIPGLNRGNRTCSPTRPCRRTQRGLRKLWPM
jgi:hypothetical protein